MRSESTPNKQTKTFHPGLQNELPDDVLQFGNNATTQVAVQYPKQQLNANDFIFLAKSLLVKIRSP